MRWIVVAAAIFASVYIALDFNALYALRTNQNTGLYLQSLVNLVQHGTTYNTADGKPHLLVHDQWLVLLAAPLAAALPRPETLIVLQVGLLSAAVVPLYAFARACGATHRTALILGIVYLVNPAIQGFAYNGFVPEHALPLLGFSLAYFARRHSLAGVAVCAQLILGVKEDEAWFLAWFGCAGALWYDRRIGLGVAGLALVNGLAYYAIIAAYGVAPERPAYGLADREVPQQLAFLLELLAPLGFAPIALGARVLLAAPFLAELFLAQDRVYPLYRTGYYYTEPLVVLAFIATAIALARRPTFVRWVVGFSAVFVLFFNPTVLHIGRHVFPADPQYGAARAWATANAPVDFPCEDEGAWVVASGNTQARLLACPLTLGRTRPAWSNDPLGSSAAWTKAP